MMRQQPETDTPQKRPRISDYSVIMVGGVCILVVLVMVFPFLMGRFFSLIDGKFIGDSKELGPLGDMYGMLNSLFSGLAFLGVLVALLMQRKDLQINQMNTETIREDFEASVLNTKRLNQLQESQTALALIVAEIDRLEEWQEEVERTESTVIKRDQHGYYPSEIKFYKGKLARPLSYGRARHEYRSPDTLRLQIRDLKEAQGLILARSGVFQPLKERQEDLERLRTFVQQIERYIYNTSTLGLGQMLSWIWVESMRELIEESEKIISKYDSEEIVDLEGAKRILERGKHLIEENKNVDTELEAFLDAITDGQAEDMSEEELEKHMKELNAELADMTPTEQRDYFDKIAKRMGKGSSNEPKSDMSDNDKQI